MNLTRLMLIILPILPPFIQAEVTTAASTVLYFNSVYQAAYLNIGTHLQPLIAPAAPDRRAPRQTRRDPRLDAKTLFLEYMLPSADSRFRRMENTRQRMQRFIEADPALDAALRSYDPDPNIVTQGFKRLYVGMNHADRPQAIWDARVSVAKLFPRLNPSVGFLPLIREAERVVRMSEQKGVSGTAHFLNIANMALQEMQRLRTIASGEPVIHELRNLQSGRIYGQPAMHELNLSTKLVRGGNVVQEVIDIRGTLDLSPGLTHAERGYLYSFLTGRDVPEVVGSHARMIQGLDDILSRKRFQAPSQIQGVSQV